MKHKIDGWASSFVKPKDHEAIREELRKKYGIWEGCIVRVDHVDVGSGNDAKTKRQTATVIAINEYHVTLEFKRGWRQSLSWMDFEQELIY